MNKSWCSLCFTIKFTLFLLSARMSGMDVPLVDHNDTGVSPIDNGIFLRFSPTSVSASAAASSPGRPGNVYVYVWLFLGLLVFLLTLIIISLHRLKNIISSSSSVPDCSSEGGSSFTNMEICSISSQRSTISSLSTWGRETWGHIWACMSMCAQTWRSSSSLLSVTLKHKLYSMHVWLYFPCMHLLSSWCSSESQGLSGTEPYFTDGETKLKIAFTLQETRGTIIFPNPFL